jgi:hypothetical protein
MMCRIGMLDVVRVVSRRQHVGRYLDCGPDPNRAFDPVKPICAVGDNGIELAGLFIEAVGHEGIAQTAAGTDLGKTMPLSAGRRTLGCSQGGRAAARIATGPRLLLDGCC